MPTPASSVKRRLADKLLEGSLDTFVTQRRNAGESWRAISAAILREIDLDISPESLRLWFTEVAA